MNDVPPFGLWVKQRRKELGLTRSGLAQRISCSVQTIDKIEAGERRPSEHMAERLAECLQVDASGPQMQEFVEYARLNCLSNETPPVSQSELGSPWQKLHGLRHPNNLPSPPNDFIGRQREVESASALMRRSGVRLLTLVGPAGVGKTRLALQVASSLIEDFPEGVFFVALSSITDPALVISAIARAVHISEVAGQPLLESVHAYLHDKQILLLLDNFEQVATAAPLVSQLLTSAPHLKVMVTSRVVLHIYGEHDFQVSPLALPGTEQEGYLSLLPTECLAEYEAVRLFVERAQASKADFVLTNENAHAVVEICRCLEGLPLAIELAAARIRLLPPQAMLTRLNSKFGNRLEFLTGGAQDLPSRQQTMRSAIEWSYDLLDEQERALFRRLSVFVNGCTLGSAEAVCNYAGEDILGRDRARDVLDGLEALLNKSLLREWVGAGGAEVGEPRYSMPEIIREYAHERLEERGGGQHTRDSHARFFLAMSEKAPPELRDSEPEVWLGRLQAEHDNLRAALQWAQESGQVEIGLRISGALWRFWYQHSHFSEGQRWLESFISRAETAGALEELFSIFEPTQPEEPTLDNLSKHPPTWKAFRSALPEALLGAGTLAWRQGDCETAHSHFEQCLAICRRQGDNQGSANALNGLAFVADDQNDHTLARALYLESLALRRELGDKGRVACSLANLGEVARCLGDYGEARAYYEESLAIRTELKDTNAKATLLHNLGHVALHTGNVPHAASLFAESLEIAQELGNRQAIAQCLAGLGGVALLKEQIPEAVRLLGAAVALLDSIHSMLDPADELEYQRNLTASRIQLDEVSWTEAWEEGRNMTMEQILSLAPSPL
ncbi:MAG: tetratricopeptide repeat protein [Chloroflexi bacterium]|nr:tetratricopeptide repeat protein [Chloroflexota bacterium]